MKNVVVLRMENETYVKSNFLGLDYDEVLELPSVEPVFRNSVEDEECESYNGVKITDDMLYDLPHEVVDVYDRYEDEEDSEKYCMVIYCVESTDPYDCQDDEEEEWY